MSEATIQTAPAWLAALAGTNRTADVAPTPPTATITDAQLADLRSALAHPGLLSSAGGHGAWSEIGYALLSLGDLGFELWCEFSERAANPNPGSDTAETWWARHARSARRSDFFHLFTLARKHGWKNPNPGGDPASIQWSPLPAGASSVPPPPGPTGVDLVRASDITPEPIRWLWLGWLPSGKLVILAGSPGTGKSTIAFTLAATVSKGGNWPDGMASTGRGNVVIWSGEDDPADTIVPRLMAAGADLTCVHIVRGKLGANGKRVAFDPATDMPQLEQRIEATGGAALLIVDPIVSAVSGDMHKASEVRRSLQALVDLGEKFDCCVIGISHFRKGSQGTTPQERVIGSQAFGALARLVLVAAESEEDGRRVLARAKSNISVDRGGIEYAIEPQVVAGNISTTRIEWRGPIQGTAREILKETEREPETGEESECAQALANALRDPSGRPIPVAKRVVEDQLKRAGYSEKQIRRAREKLKVATWLEGFGPEAKGMWKLPEGTG